MVPVWCWSGSRFPVGVSIRGAVLGVAERAAFADLRRSAEADVTRSPRAGARRAALAAELGGVNATSVPSIVIGSPWCELAQMPSWRRKFVTATNGRG